MRRVIRRWLVSMDSRLLNAARTGDVGNLREMIAQDDADLLLGVTPFRNTVLHIAVRFKKQEFVEVIYAQKPELLEMRNVNDETPLHIAAIVGSHEAVVFFLGHAAAPDVERGNQELLLRAVDRDGNNALHRSLLNGYSDVAKELVLQDPGLAASINDQKESPLYLAAMRGFSEIVHMLLQCDQSSYKGPRGQTALHAAVIEGHQEIAKALLDKKNEISKEKDDKGKTPLHYAATWGDLEMVRLLLEKDSSAAYVADNDGCTPFHLCAREGHFSIFSELFKSSPDAVDAVDARGRNALHIAIEQNTTLALDLLETDWVDRLLNQRDNEGKTPLHIAAEKRHRRILQELLLVKKVDTSATDQQGLTAVHSFYMEKEPDLSDQWHESHSIIRKTWAEGNECKQNFINNNVRRRMEDDPPGNILDTYSQNLSIVAVLMATVTFAAAFTIPGGYESEHGPEEGLVVLSRKAAIKVFLIADTISLCFSLLATYLYSTTIRKRHHQKWLYTTLARELVSSAFLGMLIAFATGIYAVVAPTCLWLGIIICVLCGILFFFALSVSEELSVGQNFASSTASLSSFMIELKYKYLPPLLHPSSTASLSALSVVRRMRV